MSLRFPGFKCAQDTVWFNDQELPAKIDYFPGQSARLYGPPEKCCEGIPARVDVTEVFYQNAWIPAIVFGREHMEVWEQQILDKIQTEEQEMMADMRSWDYRSPR